MANVTELRQEVTQRFRHWAVEECSKEVESGFVHLKTIRGSWVLGVLEFIESWPAVDQISVMQARLEWGKGTEETRLTERQRELLRLVSYAPASGFGPRYKDMLQQFATGRYRVSRGAIRSALKRELVSTLGRVEEPHGAVWKHRTQVGKWTVVTDVDSGGSGRQFELAHMVKLSEHPLFWTSPAHWWGIGMQTVWDRIAEDDVNEATRAAATLCRYFIERVPEMLRGL